MCIQFKIGLCQLSVTLDKNQNLIHAHDSIKAAAKQGAKLVVLTVSQIKTSQFMVAM